MSKGLFIDIDGKPMSLWLRVTIIGVSIVAKALPVWVALGIILDQSSESFIKACLLDSQVATVLLVTLSLISSCIIAVKDICKVKRELNAINQELKV